MKKFSTTFSGYNKNEVNKFVNDITKEYEDLLMKVKSRDNEILELRDKITKYENMETTLNKAILVAEDASNRIKKMAQEESSTVLTDAKKNASRIINEALIKAEKIDNDTLILKRKIENYKRRIKQEIENQLTVIETMDEVIDD